MSTLVTTYAYHFDSVGMHITSPIFFGVAILFAIAFALASPYVYGYLDYLADERKRLEKKRTISNLRIMNDIQSELEAEVKEARIRESLKA